MVKSLSILGCTGSIGRQSIAVAEHLGLPVAALTANRQIDRLEEQARRLHPKFVAVYDEQAAKDFKIKIGDTDIRVGAGIEGLIEAATLPEADCVVTAVSGAVGLKPTLAAIDERKRIALANKETLVCAGSLVMARAKEKGAEIVPVDSEHSAIFQCLMGRKSGELRRILLTGSGGPFRGRACGKAYGKEKKEGLSEFRSAPFFFFPYPMGIRSVPTKASRKGRRIRSSTRNRTTSTSTYSISPFSRNSFSGFWAAESALKLSRK